MPSIKALLSNWWIQGSTHVHSDGRQLSSTPPGPDSWLPAELPATPLGVMVDAGQFPDLFVGTNLRQLPGGGPEGDNLSNFPMPEDSPFAQPWWYRHSFPVESPEGPAPG